MLHPTHQLCCRPYATVPTFAQYQRNYESSPFTISYTALILLQQVHPYQRGTYTKPTALYITYDSKFDMQTYIYHWEIYYKVVATGSYTGISDIIEYLEQLLPSSGYVVCPGLKEYPEQVRFKTKHLVEFGSPFPRLISDQCSMWHIPNLAQQHNESQLCINCSMT